MHGPFPNIMLVNSKGEMGIWRLDVYIVHYIVSQKSVLLWPPHTLHITRMF